MVMGSIPFLGGGFWLLILILIRMNTCIPSMQHTNKILLSLVALCCGLAAGADAQTANATDLIPETAAQHDARMAWWRQARFGMFIHWGLYAVAAGEWRGTNTSGAGEWIQNDLKIPAS